MQEHKKFMKLLIHALAGPCIPHLRVEWVVVQVELAGVVGEVLPGQDDGVVLAREEHRLDRRRVVLRQRASLPVKLTRRQLVNHALCIKDVCTKQKH